MAMFKNEKGKEKFIDTKKRTIVDNEGTWKRIPKPKYKSRSTRLSEAVDSLNNDASLFQALIDDMGDLKEDEIKERAMELPVNVDFSEIECLKDEIENWRDGMQGTNLENSDKFSQLEDCVSYLETAVSSLEGFEFVYDEGWDADELTAELEECVQLIEEATSELENVEFPGMY